MLRLPLLRGLCVGLAFATVAGAQAEPQVLARARLFPEVGAGVRAVKRDAAGRYYVLTAPSAAVLVYDAAGKRVGQVPRAATPGSSLLYGEDMDLDRAGRLYVADRGANAVKVFDADSSLALTISVPAPTAVVALDEGELAVASMKSAWLVNVFDARGKPVRDFGEPAEIAERSALNRFLNIGKLASDPAGNIYYAFAYLPEPTVRKYDRIGYAALEIQLTTLEFQPEAQAMRREIQRQERSGAPNFKPILTAVAVDSATQHIWIAMGDLLLHFDRDGNRLGAYRTYTPEGARVDTIAILVEPERLLLAADPLGIYDFARPDKLRH
jgi:hypothetical protein